MAKPNLADIVKTLELVTATADKFSEAAGRLGPEEADPIEQLRSVLRDNNTVGVGAGYKITAGKITETVAVQIYVVKKRPISELSAAEAAPEVVSVKGGAVATDVIETGKVVPEPVLAQSKPLQPGPSIGRADQNAAGTFGAVVTKGKKYYILSNSHVLAKSGKGKKGDKIVYPAKLDQTKKTPAAVVGKLAGFKPFVVGGKYVNTADAAIASVDATWLPQLDPKIKNLWIPKGTIAPKLGAEVTKTGRTTRTTKGQKIIGLAARLKITYAGVGEVAFIDQVLCQRYSKPGDSGSLVLDRKSKKAVGLHFAGGPKGSFFSPWRHVAKAVGVTLVTKPIKKVKTKGKVKTTSKVKTTGKVKPSAARPKRRMRGTGRKA